MSFEEMILAHAAALRDNAEALRANAAATMKLAEAMGAINAIAKPEAPEKPKAAEKPAKPAPTKTPESPPAEVAIPYTLEEVRAALMTLPDRKDVTNVIGRFGVAALSQVPVEKYPELMEEVAKLKDALK